MASTNPRRRSAALDSAISPGDNANTSMTTFQQILGSQTATKIVDQNRRHRTSRTASNDQSAPPGTTQAPHPHTAAQQHSQHTTHAPESTSPHPPHGQEDAATTHVPQHANHRNWPQSANTPARRTHPPHTWQAPRKTSSQYQARSAQPAGTAWSPSYARSDSAHNSASSPRRQWPCASHQTREPADYSTPAKPSSQTPPGSSGHILQRRTIRHPNPLKTFLPPA